MSLRWHIVELLAEDPGRDGKEPMDSGDFQQMGMVGNRTSEANATYKPEIDSEPVELNRSMCKTG